MNQTRDRTAFLPRQKFYNPERGLGRQILILIWLQRIFRHLGCKGSYIGVMSSIG
jgi:hypothetical protein